MPALWKLILERVVIWVGFAGVLALLPVVFNVITAASHDQTITFTSTLSRGELFLVSVGVVAGAAGEMFGGGRQGMEAVLAMLVLFVVVLVSIGAYWSGDIAASVRASEAVNEYRVAVGSAVMFVFSVVTGTCCIVLSELRR